MSARSWLFIALGLFTVFYLGTLLAGLTKARRESGSEVVAKPTPAGLGIGFITNFFDTLGIGSYATTTTMYRLWKLVRDEHIPGTLNVGHTLPVIAQAYIFTTIVPVDSRTLILMIGASVLGAWIGAGIVAGLSRRAVQIGMGLALIAAATFMLLSQLGAMPGGGEALALTGAKLGFALVGNFVLGSLMTLGIGLYAPCMVLVSLLGMNIKAAFPIMMGSCAFLMPVASARFVKKNSYDLRAALGLAVGGIPAVLLAAFIIKSLPLTAVRWLVVGVVLYTAAGLLRTAYREGRVGRPADTAEEAAV
ncbi:MAG: sulfite exporter TauE/SafE family protein [Gemmatimonadetes bacterium]|nr:sulfite exporter TauE/SafE family protein [Gemmatimonadota bacterium]